MKPRPNPSSHPASESETGVWTCLALVAAVWLVFWPVVTFNFTNFDDPDYFTANGRVQAGLTRAGVRWAFTTLHTANWHPLTWLSLMADAQLGGGGSAAPHATNLLLHSADTVLLFLLLRRLTRAHWRSALVAGLFALHPLHVESVAWVAERKDVLSTFFGLLSVWCYGEWQKAKGKRQKHYLAALLCFALSLMSKPMLVTLPCMLLLLDWWPLGRMQKGEGRMQNWRGLIVEKLPFFALSVASSVVTFFVQRHGGAVVELVRLPWESRAANALVAYARYLGKTFWPVDLAFFYPHPGQWPAVTVLGAAVLLLAVTALAFRWRTQRPYLLVGWLWFLGTLVPVIGLVQVGAQAMADRYAYVPLIGIFIIVAWGLAELQERWRTIRLAAALGASLLGGAGVVAARQVQHWRDSETLCRHALAVSDQNYMAHANLGWYFVTQKRPTEAVAQFRQAIALYSNQSEAFNGLGYAETMLGLPEEAVADYRRAVELTPHNAAALNNLGYARFTQGHVAEAMEAYRAALRENPDYADALNNLGYALAQQGQPAEAIPQYEAALRADARHLEARNNLGMALDDLGRADEAIRAYQEVLRRQPDHLKAHSNLGIALAKQGRLPEALAQFRRAVELDAQDPLAHNNLGAALALDHQLEAAVAQYRLALQTKPDYAEAHNNLGDALTRLGRRAEAIAELREALRLKPDYPEARRQLAELEAGTPPQK